METEARIWTVVSRDGTRLIGPDIAEAVARVLELKLIDARWLVRYAGGIMDRGLGEVRARELAGAISGLGLPVDAIPAEDLPLLPPVRTFPRIARLEAEALVVEDKFGEEVAVAKAAVWSVAVHARTQAMKRAPLSAQEAKRMRREAIRPINMPGEIERLREEIGEHSKEGWDLEILLSVFCADPIVILEASHKDLSYGHLGELLHHSALENFVTTARDVASWAEGAFKPADTLDFLREPAAALISVGNYKELERRRVWTLYHALKGKAADERPSQRLPRQDEAPPPPSPA